MTDTPAMRQLRRIPVIVLVALALLIAGLLLLAVENTGARAPVGRHLDFVKTSSVQSPGTDFDNPGGNPDKHCNDGKGQDDERNKHCRGISGT
jgi:hypothetical protein